MQKIELGRQKTTTNGQTEVTVVGPVPVGERWAVVSLRYANRDTVGHTPSLWHNDGTTSEILETRPMIPAGGIDKSWCSGEQPIHLNEGETLRSTLNEVMATVDGFWLAAYHASTVSQ